MAKTDTNENIPILAWEVTLNIERQSWKRKVAAAASNEVQIQQESHQTEICREENEVVFVQEVKSTVKQLFAFEMVTMVREALDEALRKRIHNAQSGI